MKTINIKGKEYVPVVERIKEFHKLYPEGSIETEIVRLDTDRISVKAIVLIPGAFPNHGYVCKVSKYIRGETNLEEMPECTCNAGGSKPGKTFTGHSQAVYGKGMMGEVALEIAETSAIGRALGFANIGLIDSVASADEMRKANIKSNPTDEPPF